MADDWFDKLYSGPSSTAFPAPSPAGEGRRPRFAAGPVRGGGRLPSPGQVIDLGPAEPAPAAPVSLDKEPSGAPSAPDTTPDARPDTTDSKPDERGAEDTPPDPAQQDRQPVLDELADAITRLADRLPSAEDAAQARRDILHSDRARAAAYNISAATAGVAPALLGADWNAPGIIRGWLDAIAADASIGAALVIGTGLAAAIWALWDRRTRHLPPWLAWTCRIPLATTVAAVLLWAPGWDSLNL